MTTAKRITTDRHTMAAEDFLHVSCAPTFFSYPVPQGRTSKWEIRPFMSTASPQRNVCMSPSSPHCHPDWASGAGLSCESGPFCCCGALRHKTLETVITAPAQRSNSSARFARTCSHPRNAPRRGSWNDGPHTLRGLEQRCHISDAVICPRCVSSVPLATEKT